MGMTEGRLGANGDPWGLFVYTGIYHSRFAPHLTQSEVQKKSLHHGLPRWSFS